MRPSILSVVNNPANPWLAHELEWLGPPPKARLTVFNDASKTILARNDSEDLPFRWSLNPYRGCYHGCAYCYARPSHQYLDFGAGTDFDRKLVLKRNCADLLRAHFMKKSWQGEVIMFSGNTDCYQPLEASYELTRACLEVCREFQNPVDIITKGCLIERDLELLVALHKVAFCHVHISIPFWDAKNARAIEPYVPSPQRRIQTIKALAEAGVPVSVMVGPVIPGLNDSDIPDILKAAKAAGARSAHHIMLRLSETVAQIFEQRLRASLPLRADKILNQIRDCRGGRLNNSEFGARMRGQGPRWKVIEKMFKQQTESLGLNQETPMPIQSTFQRPGPPMATRPKKKQKKNPSEKQLSLFAPAS